MKKKRAALVAALLTCAPLTPFAAAQASQASQAPAYSTVWLSVGAQGHAVTQVQYMLRSFGYGVGVDGLYGPQTAKAVAHWQRANGLHADGIVGPTTWRRMGLDRPTQAPAPVPAPTGQPTGTPQTGLCSQYHGLIAAAGMPVTYFARIMYRESGCDPMAYNGRRNDRSYGLLQINTKGALWGELQWRCGLTDKNQLFDPATNVACAARLYRVYGTRPWRTR